jgi:hypothetical protein
VPIIIRGRNQQKFNHMKQKLIIIAIATVHISGLALLIANNASLEPAANNQINIEMVKAANYVSPVSAPSSPLPIMYIKNNGKEDVCNVHARRRH